MSELTLKDVTPQVEIVFKKLAASVITMQEKGRVLFIAKDATLTEDYTVKTYTSAVGITDITGTLKQDVIDIFDGGVKKVILLTVKTDIDTVAAVLPTLKFDRMFTNIAAEQATVANYAKENEKFAVVYNVAKDCMHVVNFVTPSATLEDGTTVETVNILPYVAGQLAGCPYTRSIMAKELTHFSDATLPDAFLLIAHFFKQIADSRFLFPRQTKRKSFFYNFFHRAFRTPCTCTFSAASGFKTFFFIFVLHFDTFPKTFRQLCIY